MLESELDNGDSDQIESMAEESVDIVGDLESNSIENSNLDSTTDTEPVADTEPIADTEPVTAPSSSENVKPVKGKRVKKTTGEKEKTKSPSKKKDNVKSEVKDKENDDVEINSVKVIEPEIPKGKDWYILKVQVNREDIIKKQIEQRAKIAGLDQYFGDILVPTEKVTEIRNEKKRIVKRKLYPGYLMIYMEINDDTWFLVRETPGIGDFTGAVGKPTPMLAHEVQRMLAAEKEDPAESPKLKVGYSVGDQIKIKEGSFESLSGVVDAIDYASGRVTVIVNLFGRSTPVELEYWQIEQSAG
jgi:transcriptional antiterminator NusG